MTNNILIVFPHPDDEAFGVSGTIMQHIEDGDHVTYACLTLGEMGRNLGNPPIATRESLRNIRKEELINASKVMGIQDLRMLGYRDKTVEFEPFDQLTAHVKSIIEELNPTKIISFYPGFCVHPDHEATASAVIEAVKQLEPSIRPMLHLVAFSNDTEEKLGAPDVEYNISQFTERKLKTLEQHASQTGPMLEKLANDSQVSDEERDRWLKYERFYTYKV